MTRSIVRAFSRESYAALALYCQTVSVYDKVDLLYHVNEVDGNWFFDVSFNGPNAAVDKGHFENAVIHVAELSWDGNTHLLHYELINSEFVEKPFPLADGELPY